MRFFREEDVRRLLPMRTALQLMRGVFAQLATQRAANQPRRRLILPTGSALHYMAGATEKYFGAKIYSTHPRQGAHFLFLLYRADDAKPLALFEANSLGQIRTGAVSGHATALLARNDADTLGIIGSGFQARSQLEAIACVRPLRSVKVWSRSPENRAAFAKEAARKFELDVRATETAREAVEGSTIVVTATNARDPVIEDGWIGRGVHINAMGSNHEQRRELPAELIRRADLIAVDSLEQARIESGDLLLAFREDAWTRVVELQDVRGGPSDDALTIFKSLGLAVEDVAAAGYVYEQAISEGIGTELPVYS
ncbi:MAG: ornithine cyclodeaminase family protein [Bryobacteraceae bacterium]